MNRRGFLQSLIGAAVAIQQLDIEKLLWVPGEKTIFIPPPKIQQYVFIRTLLPPVRWRKLNEGVYPVRMSIECITLEEFKDR